MRWVRTNMCRQSTSSSIYPDMTFTSTSTLLLAVSVRKPHSSCSVAVASVSSGSRHTARPDAATADRRQVPSLKLRHYSRRSATASAKQRPIPSGAHPRNSYNFSVQHDGAASTEEQWKARGRSQPYRSTAAARSRLAPSTGGDDRKDASRALSAWPAGMAGSGTEPALATRRSNSAQKKSAPG